MSLHSKLVNSTELSCLSTHIQIYKGCLAHCSLPSGPCTTQEKNCLSTILQIAHLCCCSKSQGGTRQFNFSLKRTTLLCDHLRNKCSKMHTKTTQQISCRRKRLYFPLQLWLFLLATGRILDTVWTVIPAEVWTLGCDKWARNAVIHCYPMVGS